MVVLVAEFLRRLASASTHTCRPQRPSNLLLRGLIAGQQRGIQSDENSMASADNRLTQIRRTKNTTTPCWLAEASIVRIIQLSVGAVMSGTRHLHGFRLHRVLGSCLRCLNRDRERAGKPDGGLVKRILIADDHVTAREGLRAILD